MTKKRVKFVDGGNSEATSQVAVLFPLKGSTHLYPRGRISKLKTRGRGPPARVAALPRGGEVSGLLLTVY